MTTQRPSDPSNAGARIALVGHCGPDSWMLKSVVARAVPGAEVVMVSSQQDAVGEAGRAGLLLVNRLLDGEFADDSGVELIRRLSGMPGRTASLMLVSNYDDAQAQAVQAGAVRGFGKSSAGTAATAEAIRAAARSEAGR